MKLVSGSVGFFIGILFTGALLSRCHQKEMTDIENQHAGKIESIRSSHQRQIDKLADVDEECAELYNRNLELEAAAINFSTQLLMTELDCIRRINKLKKELQ